MGSRNIFETEMVAFRKGFDEVMHENYEYEQKVNQQFLEKQSVSPGGVNILLHSQKTMNRIRAAQGKKDSKFQMRAIDVDEWQQSLREGLYDEDPF